MLLERAANSGGELLDVSYVIMPYGAAHSLMGRMSIAKFALWGGIGGAHDILRFK